VHEALLFSASLRLQNKPSNAVVADFVDEIMAVVELMPLRHALVGVPGIIVIPGLVQLANLLLVSQNSPNELAPSLV